MPTAAIVTRAANLVAVFAFVNPFVNREITRTAFIPLPVGGPRRWCAQ